MATIRRNKYGKLMYASMVTGTLVTGFTTDEAAAKQLTDDEARAVVEAHKARGSANGGQLAALDAKGKTIALWGEPGEPPAATPKPVASLPGLAEQVADLTARVELIEASDAGGTGGGIVTKSLTESQTKEIEAALAKAVKGMPLLLKSDLPQSPFTAEEVAALKGMLGEWAAHKAKESSKDKQERKEQQANAGGGQKVPAG